MVGEGFGVKGEAEGVGDPAVDGGLEQTRQVPPTR